MTMQAWIQLGSAFFSAFSFAMMYNVRGLKLIGEGVGGFLVWGVYLLMMTVTKSDAACTAAAALFAYGYAQMLARRTKSPSTVFLAPVLIPLVPGGNLYYAMLAAVVGDWQRGFQYGVKTLWLTGAIAVALTIGSSLTSLMGKLRHRAQDNG